VKPGAAKSKRAKRVNWETAPCVFQVRVTCQCGSADYDRVRTENNGDGSATQKRICRNCRLPYKVVFELPDSGKVENLEE
jgi:hypothetical protein